MGLEKYRSKREFNKTSEPKGKLNKKNKKGFVVQKHQASHLHWDFRIEDKGVLKSWAIPKEPPKTKGLKRLAIKVEDHPVEYAKFEGEIKEGYGKGTVKIWDKGNFEFEDKKRDKLVFDLNGQKMKGKYVLIKTKYAKNSWLLFKN